MSALASRIAAVAPTRTELVPWTDRRGRFHPLRATTFGLLLLPGLWLAFRWAADMLGPERVNAAIHSTGYWTVWILLASLTVSPLKALAGMPNLVVVRRMVGNAAIIYAAIHLALYSIDQHWRLLTIASEILTRFYLTIGFVALLGLATLAATSTDGWMRSLGSTWKRLHRLVYGLAVLGLIHYLLQSKLDVSQSLLAGGVFTWLMLWRLLPSGRDRSWQPLLAITFASVLLTIIYEYGWYRFGTHLNPMRVLSAELNVGYGLHPASQVLLLGVLAAAGTELRRLSLTRCGGTAAFTMLVYALGALVSDLLSVWNGWLIDDTPPDGALPAVPDLSWIVLLGLLGLARWRLRATWQRRLIDAVGAACVLVQAVLVSSDSRSLGAVCAGLTLAGALLFGSRVWRVSRTAALALVPLCLLLAYQAAGLLYPGSP